MPDPSLTEDKLIADIESLTAVDSPYIPGYNTGKDTELCRRINKYVAEKTAEARYTASMNDDRTTAQSPAPGPAALLASWKADVVTAAEEPEAPIHVEIDPSVVSLSRQLTSSLPDYSGQHWTCEQLSERYQLALQLLGRDLTSMQATMAHLSQIDKVSTSDTADPSIRVLFISGSKQMQNIAGHAKSGESAVESLYEPASDNLRGSMVLLHGHLKASAESLQSFAGDMHIAKQDANSAVSEAQQEATSAQRSSWASLRDQARLVEKTLIDTFIWQRLTADAVQVDERSSSEMVQAFRSVNARYSGYAL